MKVTNHNKLYHTQNNTKKLWYKTEFYCSEHQEKLNKGVALDSSDPMV